MGKEKQASLKVAKGINDPKAVIAEYHVTAHADGSVAIHGPIDNLLMYMDIMNAAEKGVIKHTSDRIARAGAQNKVIVPKFLGPRDIGIN
ncbi:MAG: hypothetical protein U1C57_01935 [Candidatus Doudnabacteria bacterium]|nr:hypothetical protein [Desulfobacterales bacterium]MDZ4243844.1 hypothetical protein [Candidatus Doudnabacteria bacterium]